MTYEVEYDATPVKELLRTLREKSITIREQIMQYAQADMKQNVQDDVLEYMAPYPANPAVHPFMFATDKSRAWYFWAMRTGFFSSQEWDDAGGGWQRTETLLNSWYVDVSDQFKGTLVHIGNNAVNEFGDEYSQAVYGPDAVQGHVNTGWEQDFSDALDKITDGMTGDLLDALETALSEF